MKDARSILGALVIAALTAGPARAQDGSLSLFAFGGYINSPADFDVGRSVDYGAGFRFGGGFGLQLYEHVGVRFEASLTATEGTDTSGGINETVNLDRQFYGAAVEFQLWRRPTFEPYVYVGGGTVILDRTGATASSYSYDVTEFTGLVGGGLRYLMPSNLHVFVEGTGWLYNRAANDTSQFDTALSVGVGYRFGT